MFREMLKERWFFAILAALIVAAIIALWVF